MRRKPKGPKMRAYLVQWEDENGDLQTLTRNGSNSFQFYTTESAVKGKIETLLRNSTNRVRVLHYELVLKEDFTNE